MAAPPSVNIYATDGSGTLTAGNSTPIATNDNWGGGAPLIAR